MEAKVQEFINSILGYDYDQLFALCIEMKRQQLSDAVVIAEFRNSAPAMAKEYKRVTELLAKREKAYDELEKKYNHVCSQLTIEKNQRFGKHSEQAGSLDELDPDSLRDLLSEDMDEDQSGQNNRDNTANNKNKPSDDDTEAKIRKTLRTLFRLMYGPQKNKKRDFSRLPRRDTFLIDIEECDKRFGQHCWEIASWHKKEFLHRLPTQYYVEVRHVPVIKSRISKRLFHFPMPGVMRSHSPVTPSVVAGMIYDKAFMAAPLNRISDDMENQGLTLSRQVLSDWLLYYTENRLGIASDYMEEKLRGYKYGQGDETTLQVIHDGRKAGSKGFMWLHTSSELDTVDPIAVFRFEFTRHTDHLRRFYKACALFLTCDAYPPYGLLEKESAGEIIISGCFMHARRRFWIAFMIIASRVSEEQWQELPEYIAILLIAEIYQAEMKLCMLSPEERKHRRDTEVRPHVEAFFDFVHSFDISAPTVSEKMKDAIQYCLNQEDRLKKFLDDGRIPIDNGYAERIFKRYAIGRRNWLFCNTERGANALGIIYTVVETARLNHANPLLYLEFLLEKTPEYMDISDRTKLEELMPWSEVWRKWEAEKTQTRINEMLPQSQEKPYYRPYVKKQTEETSLDIQTAG